MRKNVLQVKANIYQMGRGGLGQKGFYGFNFSSPLLGPQ
jgi:hypothetical protein